MKCGEFHPELGTRCTRGKVHVTNDIAHCDDNLNTWPVSDGEKERLLRPDEEFKSTVQAAVRTRLRRSVDTNPAAVVARYNDCKIMAAEAIEEMLAVFSRLDG